MKCKRGNWNRSRFLFELAEENKIKYNQAPVNTLIEIREKSTTGFSANGYIALGDGGELLRTNAFSEDSSEMAKFLDEKLGKFDDHPSTCYTGTIYRCFRKYNGLNWAELGKGANEINNFLE